MPSADVLRLVLPVLWCPGLPCRPALSGAHDWEPNDEDGRDYDTCRACAIWRHEAECGRQLVTHLHHHPASGALVCLWCAQALPPAEVVSVSPDAEGFVPGVEALEPADAVALLVRRGARPAGGEVSR